MALPLYLAMTAAEIRKNPHLPDNPGYMACHFSPYGTGLSNLPENLPPGTLLIFNDRTPIHGHNPHQILDQLSEILDRFRCRGLLLDFQRPDCLETKALAAHLVENLPRPPVLSNTYAEGFSCPVLLPPAPLDTILSEYISPWSGREIWLEAALDAMQLTLTDQSCTSVPLPCPTEPEGFHEPKLHCHYHIQLIDQKAEFTLYRTREDLDTLLEEAEALGISAAVGLWQELG